jgi:hypothetical protein
MVVHGTHIEFYRVVKGETPDTLERIDAFWPDCHLVPRIGDEVRIGGVFQRVTRVLWFDGMTLAKVVIEIATKETCHQCGGTDNEILDGWHQCHACRATWKAP